MEVLFFLMKIGMINWIFGYGKVYYIMRFDDRSGDNKEVIDYLCSRMGDF